MHPHCSTVEQVNISIHVPIRVAIGRLIRQRHCIIISLKGQENSSYRIETQLEHLLNNLMKKYIDKEKKARYNTVIPNNN